MLEKRKTGVAFSLPSNPRPSLEQQVEVKPVYSLKSKLPGITLQNKQISRLEIQMFQDTKDKSFKMNPVSYAYSP